MGQKQSGPKGNSQIEAKTSYYELLNIERDATDDEIKKAYRRKALELHPDRNYGDVERATKLFADIQSAYEVLSDPQERAWYDSHEEAILGKASTEDGHEQYERDIGLTTAEDVIATVQNYNKNISFSDKPSGFYGFLRDFFSQLAQEEEVAAVRQGIETPDWPSFGQKDDDSEDVRGFYSKWTGFSTCKTFEWRNYRIDKDAERAHRRYMETYNKRIREDAKNEFTQAVRQLARFVRKRDPRMPQAKSEKEVEASLRDAVAAQKVRAAKAKAENDAKLAEDLPEWVQAREPDEAEEQSEEESEEEHFECVACKKTFKSEKSWEAHEKSKKHIKTVQQLRRRLQKEGHDLDVDGESAQQNGTETPQDEMEDALGYDSPKSTNDIAEQVADLDIEPLTPELVQESKLAEPAHLVDREEENDVDYEDRKDSIDGEDNDNAVVESGSEPSAAVPEHDSGVNASKKGKAKQKREKRAAQQASSTSQTQHQCASCKASFPSRNRLFQHINDWHGGPPKGGRGKKK